MYEVSIDWPDGCKTNEDRVKHLESIIEWGDGAMNDQDQWNRFKIIVKSAQGKDRLLTGDRIYFIFRDEIDAMSIKMAWS